MVRPTPLNQAVTNAEKQAEQSSRKIADAALELLRTLPIHEQERILTEWSDRLRPITTPRAGEVLGTIVKFLPRRREWSVGDIKQEIDSQGVRASTKNSYNALGYLTRKKHIKRVGYGRYLVDGVGIETSDELTGDSPVFDDE